MTTKIITISNAKGGVGKTTLAVNLGSGMARRGMKVLIIDVDPQANCSTSLGMPVSTGVHDLLTMDPFKPKVTDLILDSVLPANIRGLWLLPGSTEFTSEAQQTITATNKDMGCLALSLMRFKYGFDENKHWPLVAAKFMMDGEAPSSVVPLDAIIIDTSPSAGGLQARAIWAADFLLIPTIPHYLAMKGMVNLVNQCQVMSQKIGWKGSLLGVLPNLIPNPWTTEARKQMTDLEKLPRQLILPMIHESTVFTKASGKGCDIVTYAETEGKNDPYAQRASTEYRTLVEAIIRRMGQAVNPTTARASGVRAPAVDVAS